MKNLIHLSLKWILLQYARQIFDLGETPEKEWTEGMLSEEQLQCFKNFQIAEQQTVILRK